MASTHRLIITTGQTEVAAEAGRLWSIGRDRAADVHVDHDLVSRRHAAARFEPGAGWVVEDLDSHNGMFVDGRRVPRVVVGAPVTIMLGDPVAGARLEVSPEDQVAPRPGGPLSEPAPPGAGPGQLASVYRAPAATLRIGRATDNDVVVDDLLVSRHHAEIRRLDGQLVLDDLHSHNGTFLDGQPVTGPTVVPEHSLISIGRHLFRLEAGRLEEYVDTGAITFGAFGVQVLADDGRRLVDDVTFSLDAHSFLAVLGPTGAGKSTLLRALTGLVPADGGQVFYNGRDLYRDYPELRRRIGFVPQDDVLHTQLTLRHALEYAARLRLPADLSAAERGRRVAEVIEELGLTARADAPITRLSGGQRKRTSVALELLAQPSLLFLDEPTSGLDPGYEKMLMELLRSLADAGRTVVTVTHSVQSLDLCDRVLFLAPGGSTAYFGPPAGVAPYFGVPDYAGVFRELEETAPATTHARWVADHPAPAPAALAPPARGRGTGGRHDGGRPHWWGQFATLTRRYVATMTADRRSLLLLVLQAPLIGLLLLATTRRNGLAHVGITNVHASVTLANLMLAVTFLGLTNAIREIVKEDPVYRRERATGLSLSAYLSSKVVVLGTLTVVQAAFVTGLALVRAGLTTHGAAIASAPLELVVMMSLGGLGAMGLGLLISSVVDSTDKALILLPIVLFVLFIMAAPSADFSTKPVVRQLAAATSAKWTYAGAASTIDIYEIQARPECEGGSGAATSVSAALQFLERQVVGLTIPDCDPAQRHTTRAWVTDALALVALTAAELVAAGLLLRRHDPHRRRRRRRRVGRRRPGPSAAAG